MCVCVVCVFSHQLLSTGRTQSLVYDVDYQFKKKDKYKKKILLSTHHPCIYFNCMFYQLIRVQHSALSLF